MMNRVKNETDLKQIVMKKIVLIPIILFASLLQTKGQISDKETSGWFASFRGGYDIKPFYNNNNTPYIVYKGGMAAGASINYYWRWIGLGGDFDYIQNRPESTYPASTASVLTQDKITRMFYGVGPSFKYQPTRNFAAELFLRAGLGTVKGGYTEVASAPPTQLLNFHAGYDDRSVFSAKAQLQFNYYFSPAIGLHAGAYYLNHFKVNELTDPNYGLTAAYVPVKADPKQPDPLVRNNPCNCDISSLGAFAGISVRIPKRRSQPKPVPQPECHNCDVYTLTVTARDKYTKEVLPNTDVIVKNIHGEIMGTGTTNSYGVVIFNNIKPGKYAISGKLYEVDLEGAVILESEFKTNGNVHKEIVYADDRFILRGIVVECNAAHPLTSASVVLINKAVAEQKNTNTDDKGGFVFHALQNATYDVYAKKNNYFSQTETITTNHFDRNKTLFVKLEVCMEKTDCGKAITLKNIHYDLDKYFIREDAKPELNKLAQFMKDNPEVKVELASHTDSRASDSYNMTLSQNRANAAVEYLVAQGISRDRLIPVGYGERKLLNKCKDGVPCSEEEHQLNRRTEMKIICPNNP